MSVFDRLMDLQRQINSIRAQMNGLSLVEKRQFLDEDDMASDSALAVASQQSIKAYVDGVVSAISCRAYHNAGQSIPNSVPTALSLNSERWDTDGIHDNVTNNSRLTCKTAGYYSIMAAVDFTSNNTGNRVLYIRLNGTAERMSAPRVVVLTVTCWMVCGSILFSAITSSAAVIG